eukprot:scaffold30614_cov63-Phaeocystis_antarctica.AAC.4
MQAASGGHAWFGFGFGLGFGLGLGLGLGLGFGFASAACCRRALAACAACALAAAAEAFALLGLAAPLRSPSLSLSGPCSWAGAMLTAEEEDAPAAPRRLATSRRDAKIEAAVDRTKARRDSSSESAMGKRSRCASTMLIVSSRSFRSRSAVVRHDSSLSRQG